MRFEVEDADRARERALSEIGSCHGVKRARIQIDEIVETRP